MNKPKPGFTLVELSIVLVIVGLLIGGILVAQSMIQTARITAAVRKIQQFDTAVTNFQTKYNQFPGDSSFFGGGNNDGAVVDFTSFIGNGGGVNYGLSSELSRFWNHLQLSGFLSNATYAITIPASGFTIKSATPNAPNVVLDTDTAVGITGRSGNLINQMNYHFGTWEGVGGGTGWFNIGNSVLAVKPATVLAIDAKIDDGDALYGSVGVTFTNNACHTNSTYLVSNSGLVCSMFVKILSQTTNGQ